MGINEILDNCQGADRVKIAEHITMTHKHGADILEFQYLGNGKGLKQSVIMEYDIEIKECPVIFGRFIAVNHLKRPIMAEKITANINYLITKINNLTTAHVDKRGE